MRRLTATLSVRQNSNSFFTINVIGTGTNGVIRVKGEALFVFSLKSSRHVDGSPNVAMMLISSQQNHMLDTAVKSRAKPSNSNPRRTEV